MFKMKLLAAVAAFGLSGVASAGINATSTGNTELVFNAYVNQLPPGTPGQGFALQSLTNGRYVVAATESVALRASLEIARKWPTSGAISAVRARSGGSSSARPFSR